MEPEHPSRGPRPLRILIVRVGAMGDVLHGLPAVAALREALPECFIGWAIEPRWSGLLEAGGVMPLVDRMHLVPTREWKLRPFSLATLRQIVHLRRELRAEQYDLCVDLQGTIRSAAIGRMAHAGRFLGPRRPRERQARALYGERVEVQGTHVIEQACELIGAGISQTLTPARVPLPQDAESQRWCVETLQQQAATDGFVLIAPGAGWGAKQWQPQRYAKLAEGLNAAGYRVLVNAGVSHEAGVEAITQHGAATSIQCTIPQLIELTRHASLVIGGDTGPVHLAAALGVPVVALFGPTDPQRNGPAFPGARVSVLRHPSSTLDHSRHAETEAGLARIGVDEVLAAALESLKEGTS